MNSYFESQKNVPLLMFATKTRQADRTDEGYCHYALCAWNINSLNYFYPCIHFSFWFQVSWLYNCELLWLVQFLAWAVLTFFIESTFSTTSCKAFHTSITLLLKSIYQGHTAFWSYLLYISIPWGVFFLLKSLVSKVLFWCQNHTPFQTSLSYPLLAFCVSPSVV